MIEIKVQTDFTEKPGARYYGDGEASGEEFFDVCIAPNLRKAMAEDVNLVIDFDGTEGFPNSFFSESFNRLCSNFGKKVFYERIVIVSNEVPKWIKIINQIVKDYDQ